MTVAITLPDLNQINRRVRVRLLAREVQAVLEQTQADAGTFSANRAVRFNQTTTGWRYTVHEDRNGNGVLYAEIVSGVDATVGGPLPLGDPASEAVIGFPPGGAIDPDTGQFVDPDSLPVNFNRSVMCSFSPDRSATPGSVYVNAGNDVVAAVRCSREGVIRTLYWNSRSRTWSP
ncbi:MAG: hypothetical protein ACXVJO_13725, partial [Thermoanaerobaculia bacterium]